MSAGHNITTNSNGLVFAFDSGNTAKSFIGNPATNNLLPYPEDFSSDWAGNMFGNWINAAVTPNVSIAPDGNLTADRLTNGYARFQRVACSTNTTYTFSIYVKNVNLTIDPMLHIAFGLNGTLVNYNNFLKIKLSDIGGWKRYVFSITSPASGINQIEVGLDFSNQYNQGTSIDVWGAKLEVGSTATPYYSTSTSVKDLTGNYLMSRSGLQYDANGAPTFLPASYIDLNTNSLITGMNPFTIDTWYYNAGQGVLIGNYGIGYVTNTIWFFTGGLFLMNGDGYIPNYSTRTSGMHNIVATRDGAGYVNVYFDGNLEISNVLNTTPVSSNQNWRIGADVASPTEQFSGTIHSLKVYNRSLSTTEVKQNFQALRTRFGI